jgi:hypothetical protein
MRRMSLAALCGMLVTLASTGSAAAAPAATAPTVVGPGTVKPLTGLKTGTRTFPVYGPDGALIGANTYRVTPAGGNCCEAYVAATPKSRLVVLGGTYPAFSDDRGKTWSKVEPVEPLNNGEGAIVPGPGGSIIGIGWDPYTGDHLQSFYMDGISQAWSVGEVPLHNGFYDRPWITYARGPFKIGGREVPFISLVRGGTASKDPMLLSVDGVRYDYTSSPGTDEKASAPDTKVGVPVVASPLADYDQPHPGAGTIPLSGGGVLKAKQGSDMPCALSIFRAGDTDWRCSNALIQGINGGCYCMAHQDSRGWLAAVSGAGRSLNFVLSSDGGANWQSTTLTPPTGGTLDGDILDLASNGHQGLAAVLARFVKADGTGQDMVFRIDTSTAAPRLIDTMLLGRGDLNTEAGVLNQTGSRFDYGSIAILPDGSIAASFDDTKTHGNPATVEQMAFYDSSRMLLGQNEPELAIELEPRPRS